MWELFGKRFVYKSENAVWRKTKGDGIMMKRMFCLLMVMMMLAAMVSCGAMAKNEAMDMAAKPGEMYAPDRDGGVFEDHYYAKGESVGDIVEAPSEEAQNGFEEKLIVTVRLYAETTTFEKSLAAVREAVVSHGGYEESFNANGKSYGSSDTYCRNATLTLRIPSEKLDEFLGMVGGLVNITSESNSMQNATEEYYDLASRVKVLEEERAAYENMLAKAMEVEDVLIIKDRLYNVISEIESAKTRMKVIDSRASYSTVHLSLQEVIVYSQVPTVKTTFGERIGNSFRESWQNFGTGCQNFAVWFVGAIPTLLVLAAIGTGVGFVGVRVYRKKKDGKKD
jgi:hypothetical protein